MRLFTDRSAVIVVDVQNDFAHPEGSLCVDGAKKAIEAVNDLISRAQEADRPVIYTADWHPPNTPHFAKDGGVWPVHCVKNTWGAEFHGDLKVLDVPVIRKGTDGEDGYSGFTVRDPETGAEHPTELHQLLRELDVDHTIICGIATDVCVAATARDALSLGFQVTVPANATAGVELQEGDINRALDDLTTAGATVFGEVPR